MANDWNDLFVRTDKDERSPAQRRGSLSSPDIIPVGKVPVDPRIFLTEESYGQLYTQPIYEGATNYIYVRARNSSKTQAKKGKANLAMTNPAVVLWPGADGWTILKAAGSTESKLMKNGSDEIEAGDICITDVPFELVPEEFGHRCLVAWLDTQAHPVKQPPPKITSMDALVKFLVENPNYAHHNIDIVPASTKRAVLHKPYTQGNIGRSMRFELSAVNCKGFTIGYECPTPIAPGKYIVQEATVVSQSPFSVVLDFEMPANWQGVVNYYWDTKALTPPGDDSVSFTAYVAPKPGDPIYDLCLSPEHFGFTRASADDPTRYYPVGSVSAVRRP
jgi:hypothetical protein